MQVVHICFPFSNVFKSTDKANVTLDLSVPALEITSVIYSMYVPPAFLYAFIYNIYVLIEITTCLEGREYINFIKWYVLL